MKNMLKKLFFLLFVFVTITCSSQDCDLTKHKKLEKIFSKKNWIKNVEDLVHVDIKKDLDYSSKDLNKLYQILIDSACNYFSQKEVDAILDCQIKEKMYDDTLFNKIVGFTSKASEAGAKWSVTKFLNKLGYSYNEGIIAFYKSNFQKAYDYFEKQIKELKDTSFVNYCFLGRSLSALKHYSEAIEAFNKAILINNSKPEAYYELSFTYLYGFGDKEFAHKMINKALSLDPNNVYYKLLLGEIYCASDDFENGIKEFDLLLSKDDKNISVLNSRALTYNLLGNNEKTYLDYKNILKLDSVDREALIGLGSLFMKQQKKDSALFYGEKLVRCHPNYEAGYSFLGGYYLQLKVYDKAISYFSLAIKIGNSFSDLTSRGYVYSEIGEYEKAKIDLEKVIHDAENTNPNKLSIAYAFNNLGYVEYKLNHNEIALMNIEKSLTLLPENPYAYRNKALVFLNTDKKQEACEALHKAKSLKFANYYGDEVDKLILSHCK
jgi:tetratricopeptide (TPR) repeat protein